MAKSKAKRIHNSLVFTIVVSTTILLVVFGVITAAIGYSKFNDTLTTRYNESAFATATTVTQFVTGEDADAYLSGDKLDEHAQKTALLKQFCENQGVYIVYIIRPLEEYDYHKYTSIINCPSDRSGYTPWELGSVWEQKSSDYWGVYQDLMEGKLERATVTRERTASAPAHINSLIPLKRQDGTVAGIICVQQSMDLLHKWGNSYAIIISVTTALLALVVITAYVFIAKDQFVKPIRTIMDEAQRFATHNSAPDVPLDSNISRISEISALAQAVATMETATLEYIDHLSDAIAEKQKIGAELDIAKQIQEGSLPSQFPAFPDRKEFDLYGIMNPAKQVGGDFYDFFLVDPDHLAVMIGDVSGKGVPAALFMMVTKILLNEGVTSGLSPADAMAFVNDRICSHNQAEMFVTIWLGIVEISTGKVIASNAGHDQPILTHPDGSAEFVKAKRGVIVGAMEGVKYTNFEFTMKRGDKLFLYTDGVPEATDGEQKMFGLDATLEALKTLAGNTPQATVEDVVARVGAFVGEAPQFDDMTMLCMSYQGGGGETRTFAADPKELDDVNAFVEGFASQKADSPKWLMQLGVAVEEIFVNVASYAYMGRQAGDVVVKLQWIEDKLSITFQDHGKPYNPLAAKEPDVTLSAEERKEGGLGVYMTKRLVDDVRYDYVDGQNILILEKKL